MMKRDNNDSSEHEEEHDRHLKVARSSSPLAQGKHGSPTAANRTTSLSSTPTGVKSPRRGSPSSKSQDASASPPSSSRASPSRSPRSSPSQGKGGKSRTYDGDRSNQPTSPEQSSLDADVSHPSGAETSSSSSFGDTSAEQDLEGMYKQTARNLSPGRQGDDSKQETAEDELEEGDRSAASNNSHFSLSATLSRGVYHQCGTARRVKVYELKGETWFDRGTGYCAGVYDEQEDAALLVARMEEACQKLLLADDEDQEQAIGLSQEENEDQRESYVLVVNENLDTDELLLKTKVVRDDVYQRQQDTLVVWTEPDGTDMALSFQEAEGCQEVWEFLTEVQKHFLLSARGDGLDIDDAESMGSGILGMSGAGMTSEADLVMSDGSPFALPEPRMDNLQVIDVTLKDAASRSAAAREKVAEWILREDYILRLIPVFHDSEDLEQLDDLHRLCAITYTIIMLNDNALMERMLRDDAFLGVVGMLEYDPEFPSLKASYRDYLTNTARFRQVVPIPDESILTKIHQTFRIQYLKDVILARTLDDSTFAVVNSLIFYYQADIVIFCSTNESFLSSLFQLFEHESHATGDKKAEAIIFLQQLCATGKQVQLPSRLALYRTLTEWGLLIVLEYALSRNEARLRNAAAEILTSIIEYDASGVRAHILEQVDKGVTPLLTRLGSILHEEEGDLGLKIQITESIRILFDSGPDGSSGGPMLAQMLATASASANDGPRKNDSERFLNWFYDGEVDHLFAPLRRLHRVKDINSQDGHQYLRVPSASLSALYNHLCELLTFVTIHHNFRSQYWVISSEIGNRVASLLFAREKHLRLSSLRFFRACLAKGNQFINKHFVKIDLLSAILCVVEAESARDNLVTSACLEFFEHIRKDSVKPLIKHLMERHETRVRALTHHNTIGHYFQAMIMQWERRPEASGHGSQLEQDRSSTTFEAEKERRTRDLARRGENRAAMDSDEENYFQEEEETEAETDKNKAALSQSEKGLVPYSLDADDEPMDKETDEIPASKSPETRDVENSLDEDELTLNALEGNVKRKKREAEEEDDDMVGRLAKRKSLASEASEPVQVNKAEQKGNSKRLSISLSSKSEKLAKDSSGM